MFFFGSGCRVAIEFADDKNGTRVFGRNDAVRGTVTVEVAGGKKLEHLGIKIELIGQIELLYDRNGQYEFTSLVRELEGPGELNGSQSYLFDFSSVDKQYESYDGVNVRLRCIAICTATTEPNSRRSLPKRA
jgi:vacuolar protein sorting-associated protein 26